MCTLKFKKYCSIWFNPTDLGFLLLSTEESYHRLPHLVTLGFCDSVVLISPSLFQHNQPPLPNTLPHTTPFFLPLSIQTTIWRCLVFPADLLIYFLNIQQICKLDQFQMVFRAVRGSFVLTSKRQLYYLFIARVRGLALSTPTQLFASGFLLRPPEVQSF